MNSTIKIVYRRKAFTLIEMLVVIAIMLALAALAAAFAPRVSDNQRMTRAVDNLEQWLLTAKMRAKRDGLSTGIRFVQAQGDVVGTYSQFQYIQQPPPLTGGVCLGGPPMPIPPLPGVYSYTNPTTLAVNYYTGALLTSAAAGIVNFDPGSVDFTLGGTPYPNQWLVQAGDYLEINGGGVYQIGAPVTAPLNPANTLQLAYAAVPLSYDQALLIPASTPTTNFRIIRQPRLLIGEEPLTLPNNYAANFNAIPGYLPATMGSNVQLGANGIYPEILFSPTGAVVGTNAGNSTIIISVWDTTMETLDPNRVGVVGIQSRSGFIGAYSISLGLDPFYFVRTARESGM